jgi:hypothetical protein
VVGRDKVGITDDKMDTVVSSLIVLDLRHPIKSPHTDFHRGHVSHQNNFVCV